MHVIVDTNGFVAHLCNRRCLDFLLSHLQDERIQLQWLQKFVRAAITLEVAPSCRPTGPIVVELQPPAIIKPFLLSRSTRYVRRRCLRVGQCSCLFVITWYKERWCKLSQYLFVPISLESDPQQDQCLHEGSSDHAAPDSLFMNHQICHYSTHKLFKWWRCVKFLSIFTFAPRSKVKPRRTPNGTPTT